MRKAVVAITFLILILFAAAITIQRATIDGLYGFLGSYLFKEDTAYAPRYSDKAFCKVSIGMSETEVRRLLGDPLEIYPSDKYRDRTSFRYSRSPGDTHYRIRAINLWDGVVISKQAEFYVD